MYFQALEATLATKDQQIFDLNLEIFKQVELERKTMLAQHVSMAKLRSIEGKNRRLKKKLVKLTDRHSVSVNHSHHTYYMYLYGVNC